LTQYIKETILEKNCKGGLLSLENKLPYLGEEQQDGSLKISDHLTFQRDKWLRPDYDKFASNVQQNEIDCLSILIGIAWVEFCLYECSKLAQKRILECQKRREKFTHDPEWFACFEFKNLISEIRKLMDLGVQSGSLTPYDLPTEDVMASRQGDFEFSFYRYYDIKEFLLWAKQNSNPIPTEIISILDQADQSEKELEKNSAIKDLSPKWPGQPIEKWEDLSITLVTHEMVRVQTPHETKRMTYAQLGMQDNRKVGSHKKVWEALAKFAKNLGVYPYERSDFSENFSTRTKELNRTLKDFFGMTDSIFKGHYRKKNKWETKINFSSELYPPRDTAEKEKSIYDEEIEDRARSVNLDGPFQYEEP
jgi:hypothetical protein